MTLTIYNPTIEIIPAVPSAAAIWFADFNAAYDDVLTYTATLPSTHTPEQTTLTCYSRDTLRFMDFLHQRRALPDERTFREYIGLLMSKYSHGTVTRYLASARHFCKALARQYINPALDPDSRFTLMEIRQSVRNAADIPNPKSKVKTSQSALYAHGKRLGMDEAQHVLDLIDRSTVAGKRDAAILLTGFYTALRLSEITRITRASIHEEGPGDFSITVRSKGSKLEPRAIDRVAVRAIEEYLSAYNLHFTDGDPRQISKDSPLWRPCTRAEIPFQIEVNPLSTRGVARVITGRTEAAGVRIAPHDLRRTWTAWADKLKMDRMVIKEQMAHESFDQTMEYIGKPRDFSAMNIAHYGLALK